MIFSCSPDQGDATDVDFFDDFCICRSRLNSGLKRIKVYNHEVNFRYGIFQKLGFVTFIFATGKNSSKDLWMKCFHSSTQNRGITSQILNSRYGDFKPLYELFCASCGVEFYSGLM